MGGTIVGAELFLASGCKTAPENVSDLFSKSGVALLDEIAETIFPETDTPGAKAAKVGEFMAVMIRDCYSPDQQKLVIDGLADMEKRCKEKYGKSFGDMSPEQRHEFLNLLDKEQREYQKTVVEVERQRLREERKNLPPTAEKLKDPESHYFRMLRETATLGFFSSEVAAKKVIRYIETPGKYIGCMDYKKGDKVWAT